VSRGCLRIGTLFSFRSVEQHGPVRGDRREGSTSALAIVDDATIGPNSVLPPFFVQMISPPMGRTKRIQNSIFEVSGKDRDYVYSVAAFPDRRLFRALAVTRAAHIQPVSFFIA